MPYVIAVYDIEEKRVGKMLKLFRKYLTWVQNSVFEGELTEAQLKCLQAEARRIMKPGYDSIIFYTVESDVLLDRNVLGVEKRSPDPFL